MKKTLIIIPISLFIIAGCATTEEKIMPYPFETAVIEWKIEGPTNGTMITHIKGNKTVTETHAETKGETEEDNYKIDTIYIDTGEKITFADLNAMMGQSNENPIFTELKKMSAQERMDYLTDITLAVPAGQNREEYAVKTGEKEIAGQKCENYTVSGLMEICVWNTIPLYSQTIFTEEMGENITMEAVKIEINVAVPDSKFIVPADIKIN